MGTLLNDCLRLLKMNDDAANPFVANNVIDSTWYAIAQVYKLVKLFRISGERASEFEIGGWVEVTGSTGNDGYYTVISVSESGGLTSIFVSEAIPSAVVDGDLRDFRAGKAQQDTSVLTTDGKVNSALSFNGTSDYITLGQYDDIRFDASKAYTWTALIKPYDGMIEGIGGVMHNGLYGADGWSFFWSANELSFTNNNDPSEVILTGYLSYDKWYFVCITYNNGNVEFYLDNQLVGTIESSSFASTTDAFEIGRWFWDIGNWEFKGVIDVVSIFDRVLTPVERAFLWHNSLGREDFSVAHHVYRGQDGNIDHDNIVAMMNLNDSSVAVVDQELPADTIWDYVRRQVSGCGLESEDSPACQVIIDSAGDMIGNTPNPPLSVTVEKVAGGKLKLRWRYTPVYEEIAPTGFHIYIDSGEGFDFETPDATVPYGLGGTGEFSWTSDPLTHGSLYRLCIRSYRTGAGGSQNTDYVSEVADSEGPEAITGLVASWEQI